MSGDVHHGEISGQLGYYEITSSGLTHHCGQSKLYGRLCEPILSTYTQHRYKNDTYYIGINSGLIEILSSSLAPLNTSLSSTTTTTAIGNNHSHNNRYRHRRHVHGQIKNSTGHVVLEVKFPLNYGPVPQLPAYEDIPQNWDGHLIKYVTTTAILLVLLIVGLMLLLVTKSIMILAAYHWIPRKHKNNNS